MALMDKLGALLSGFSGKKAESVLGIDIGSASIKVVQLRAQKGVAVLETYGEISLGPYGDTSVGRVVKLPPEKITLALSDLIKESSVTATKAGISIQFASSLVTVLDMPKVDEDQLRRMIPIEARKYIPVPISEVTLDWFVLPEENKEPDAFDRIEKETMLQKKGQEVLLAAIQNEVLQNYQTIMGATNLNAGFYEIEIFSTIRATLSNSNVPIAVVDIGASTTKVYIVERGVVRVSHLVNAGSQHMTDVLARTMVWTFDKAERMKREWGLQEASAYSREENERIHTALLSTLNRIFDEVNRVLLAYGKRYNKNVSHVVLTGGGSSLPGLEAIARQSLSAELQIADPFSKVEAPAFLGQVLKSIGPGFAVAVGVALRRLSEQ